MDAVPRGLGAPPWTVRGQDWRHLGSGYCTRRNGESDLGIDSRLALPREAVRKAHTTGPGGGELSLDEYVMRVVTRLAPWQLWVA